MCTCLILFFGVIYVVRGKIFSLKPSLMHYPCPLFHHGLAMCCVIQHPCSRTSDDTNPTSRSGSIISYHRDSRSSAAVLPCTALAANLTSSIIGHHCSANIRPVLVSPSAQHCRFLCLSSIPIITSRNNCLTTFRFGRYFTLRSYGAQPVCKYRDKSAI